MELQFLLFVPQAACIGIHTLGGWASGSHLGRQLKNICHCSGWPGLFPSLLQRCEHCHFGPYPPRLFCISSNEKYFFLFFKYILKKITLCISIDLLF